MPSGLCVDCAREVSQNNERVQLLALLSEAVEFCPVYLRERIEAILYKTSMKESIDDRPIQENKAS